MPAPPAYEHQSAPPPVSSKSSKPKATPNINGLFNTSGASRPTGKPEPGTTPVASESVNSEKLKEVWLEYASQRKNQSGEYQILLREFSFDPPVVRVLLTNPVEESLLENFRHDLTLLLRERLKNDALTITSSIREASGKKVIYTSKEKFEHLAEKNPYLLELKDRFGLDWDF